MSYVQEIIQAINVQLASMETVNYIGNNNKQGMYSNTYNPGWRNHPNFSWSNNKGQMSAPRQYNPPGFQNQN